MYKVKEKLANEIKSKIQSIYKGFEIATEGKTIHKMLISKEVTDRDGEIIRLSGVNTERYIKNPVVLIDHNYTVDSIVGKSLRLYIEDNKMYSDFIFADTEKAQTIEKMYDGGFINASSIGFYDIDRDANNPNIITRSELFEWSLVFAGSNREALKEKNAALYEECVQKGVFDNIKHGQKEINDANKKALNEEQSINTMLENAVKESLGLEKGVYVYEIFKTEFIYCISGDREYKTYRNSYSMNGDSITLGDSPTEVETQTIRVDKKMFNSEIGEIKSMLKTLVDGKAKKVEEQDEVKKLIENKDLVQKLNKSTAEVLRAIKLLN